MINIKEFYELDSVRIGAVTIGIALRITTLGPPLEVYRQAEGEEADILRFFSLEMALSEYKRFVDLELKKESEEKQKESAVTDIPAIIRYSKGVVGYSKIGGYEIETEHYQPLSKQKILDMIHRDKQKLEYFAIYDPGTTTCSEWAFIPFRTVVVCREGRIIEEHRSQTRAEALARHHAVTERYLKTTSKQ